MQIVLKFSRYVLLLFLFSCAFAHRKEGSYSAFIFETPEFNKDQPKKLYPEKHVTLWSRACGLMALDFDKLYRAMHKEYKKLSSNQMVGISNVELESYAYFVGITVLPCLKIRAYPLVVEKIEYKKLFPIEINVKL